MSDTRFQFDEEAVIGDDHPIELIFYDKDDAGTLTPENLTDRNWFYTAKVKDTDPDSEALIALNPSDITVDSDGDADLNPTDVSNRLTFWLPAASTAAMGAGPYGHDLQSVEISSGRVFTKGIGTLTMIGDFTDRTS